MTHWPQIQEQTVGEQASLGGSQPGQHLIGAGRVDGQLLQYGAGAIPAAGVTQGSIVAAGPGVGVAVNGVNLRERGPLAASQPGFTILDPLSASLLGVFLFGEHISTGGVGLAGEALTLAVVMAGASVLSHSCLVAGEMDLRPTCRPNTRHRATIRSSASSPST